MKTNNEHPLHRLLSHYRGAFLALGVFSFFFNLLVLTMPVYMLAVFSNVLTGRSEETLLLLTLAATVALLMQGLLDFIRSRILIRIGVGLDAELTPQVLEVIVRHAAGSTQRNAQRLRDAAELRGLLTSPVIFTLFDAPFVPFYVLVIFLMHPALGMLALLGSLILLAIAVVNEMITRQPIKDVNASNARAQQRVEEFVRNADAIEAMGMMPAVLGQWQADNQNSLVAQLRGADNASITRSMATFMRTLLQIGLYGTGAYYVLHGEIQTGAIIAASILMGRALAPVESAIGAWKSMVSGKESYGRLKEVLSEERMQAYRDRMSLPAPSGRLQIDRITVAAPGSDRLTLKGIGFNLEAGEFLGVVGPSGAGKTTLAKVMVGILKPNSGSARLDGVDLASWHPDELGRHVGYLPQDVQLFAGTVKQNIARLSRQPDADAVLRAARLVGVHETILRFPNGYDTDIGDAGELLSAGQRQHLALARAVYGDPRLLVLDEPNSNLDTMAEDALLRALDEAKKSGITIIVITHRPGILKSADKLLVLKNGVIDLFGPHAQVLAQLNNRNEPRKPAHGGQQAQLSVVRGETS